MTDSVTTPYNPQNLGWKPVDVSQLSDQDYLTYCHAIEHADGVCVGVETHSKYAKRMLEMKRPLWAIREGLRFACKVNREEIEASVAKVSPWGN